MQLQLSLVHSFLLVIGVVCSVLVRYGKISDQVFAAVVATVAAYISGNTIKKVKGTAAGRSSWFQLFANILFFHF